MTGLLPRCINCWSFGMTGVQPGSAMGKQQRNATRRSPQEIPASAKDRETRADSAHSRGRYADSRGIRGSAGCQFSYGILTRKSIRGSVFRYADQFSIRGSLFRLRGPWERALRALGALRDALASHCLGSRVPGDCEIARLSCGRGFLSRRVALFRASQYV